MSVLDPPTIKNCLWRYWCNLAMGHVPVVEICIASFPHLSLSWLGVLGGKLSLPPWILPDISRGDGLHQQTNIIPSVENELHRTIHCKGYNVSSLCPSEGFYRIGSKWPACQGLAFRWVIYLSESKQTKDKATEREYSPHTGQSSTWRKTKETFKNVRSLQTQNPRRLPITREKLDRLVQ